MATALHVLPESIVAGESFTVTISGVSKTGRTCVYQFDAPTPFSVSCDATGSEFVLTLTGAQTLLLKSGPIRFVALAVTTEGGASECVDSGEICVEPSPLAVSQYAAALAAVEAAIAKYATNANRSLSIGDMSIQYRSLDELLSLRSFYLAEVERDRSGRRSGPTRLLARFAW